MTFTVLDVEQRSAEWFAAKIGRVTSTRAAKMCAKTQKGAPSSDRANLKADLVLERLTQEWQEDGYVSQAMKDGIAREPDALRAYEAHTGRLVRRAGFLSHNDLMAGCSLDGYVGDFDGVVEAKSPIPATHLEYLRTGKIPARYYWQCVHALWITGARWCDWFSYQPKFQALNLHVRLVRLERDEAVIRDYDKQLRAFLDEVEAECQAVKTLANTRAVLQEALAS